MSYCPMSTLIEHHSRVNTESDPPAYVHPLMPATYPFRSTRVLNQRSLDMCTESLGSETGSDGYSDIDHCFEDAAVIVPPDEDTLDTNGEVLEETDHYYDSKPIREKKELPQVNYHCSIGRTSKVRSFPPPLPSISRRDGVCIKMKPHRRDGNLIIEAVPVPSQNYLHCHRQNGRLILSFVNTTFEDIYPEFQVDPSSAGQKQSFPDFINYEPEEVEDQVEVVDRGILVEVKVSRQAQFQRRGTNVRKSSLVINKFVSGIPLVPININLNFNINLDLNLNPAVDGWGWRQDEEESNEKQQQLQPKVSVHYQETYPQTSLAPPGQDLQLSLHTPLHLGTLLHRYLLNLQLSSVITHHSSSFQSSENKMIHISIYVSTKKERRKTTITLFLLLLLFLYF